jgi:hypothetical protein
MVSFKFYIFSRVNGNFHKITDLRCNKKASFDKDHQMRLVFSLFFERIISHTILNGFRGSR